MSDSHKGITNSCAPGDATVNASAIVMIRGMGGWGGRTWCPDWLPAYQDSGMCCTKAKGPDPCQADVFVDAIEFCKKNGTCNPATKGAVSNDVVTPKRTAEYGSHDKVIETSGAGRTLQATPLTTLVIQTALTKEDVPFCQPCSMKRVAKCNKLLYPFVLKPFCVAGIVLD